MKVLLVEDDPMHANYLRELVEAAIPEVTHILVATDGRDGEAKARDGKVQAVVMDLRMKERNGIEAARTIWAERPDSRILFWSNYSDEAYLRGIARIVPAEAAYGYMLKTASVERMHLALRSVLVEAQIVVDREIHQIQQQHNKLGTALSEIEHAVLMDVALGLPDKLIAQRRKLSLRTVQNRLLALYDKLDVAKLEDDGVDIQLNKRVRAVTSAIRNKSINAEMLEIAEKELKNWFSRSNNS
jgi:DNA-binding NarL/FixJ family response regulator